MENLAEKLISDRENFFNFISEQEKNSIIHKILSKLAYINYIEKCETNNEKNWNIAKEILADWALRCCENTSGKGLIDILEYYEEIITEKKFEKLPPYFSSERRKKERPEGPIYEIANIIYKSGRIDIR